ncbi:MAG: hypothetical protein A4S14_00395 [Proteobacteria bacterium SG_bin9]|nr:MAG: hypothetical protein A4S14_00395 [Proteobacteria bacterium SG_bin9]
MRRSTALVGLFAVTIAAVAAITTADAQTRRRSAVVVTPPGGGTQVGTLQCQAGRSVGFVFGSSNTFDCVYRAPGRRAERYVAQVNRFGIDLGVTENTLLSWTVFAPTRQFGPGDLAGDYGGVQGSATVGVGGGANVLVGGSSNSFALQPVSVQGQTGLNVSAGIAGLQLRPAG